MTQDLYKYPRLTITGQTGFQCPRCESDMKLIETQIIPKRFFMSCSLCQDPFPLDLLFATLLRHIATTAEALKG